MTAVGQQDLGNNFNFDMPATSQSYRRSQASAITRIRYISKSQQLRRQYTAARDKPRW
jgi:hypothetical protein